MRVLTFCSSQFIEYAECFNDSILWWTKEMEEIQKVKCTSCGTSFMVQNEAPLFPSCSEQHQDH